MLNSPFVNWELGSLRNGRGLLDLDVPADGLPMRSTAPGRDGEVPAVIAEAERSSRGLTQELRGFSVTGELLARAVGPMVCAACNDSAVDTNPPYECWVQRAWCAKHRSGVRAL